MLTSFSLPICMAERDASLRLRRAVQGLYPCSFAHTFVHHAVENNLFLVKRLIKRTDMRNPDPNAKRYTSLAWAATQGHEETFQYLLSEGHDDDELSKVCYLVFCIRRCPTIHSRTLKIIRSSLFWPMGSRLLPRVPLDLLRLTTTQLTLLFEWQSSTTIDTRIFVIGQTCRGKRPCMQLL